MEVEQKRIEEDLRGQISGDVHCDNLHVQLYASDASIYELRPLGVVRPRNAQDVQATVNYAAQNGIPLHARGSGSGLAGSALGRGLVVDFSRYMRRILETGEDYVRVEPGAVLDDLNLHLAARGHYIGPDPANHRVTTIGSMVSLNASGSHQPVVGAMRDHVRSLKAVLASGEGVELGLQDVPLDDASTREEYLAGKTAEIVSNYEREIAHGYPATKVNTSGYRLDGIREAGFGAGKIHLGRLFCGSEGTLGLITEAIVATLPLPPATGSLMLFFESVEKAAHAAVELLALAPSACDLMDRRHLTLARETDPRYEFLVPAETEAVLLVEYQGENAAEVQERVIKTEQLIQQKKKLSFASYAADDQLDHEIFWQLARHYTPTLYRLKGLTRPLPFIEDIAIPPESLPQFLPRIHQIFQREQITASLFAHATHGQLHFRPFLDLANTDDIRKMQILAEEIYPEVWRLRGTISGEHGDGYSRTPFVSKQFGPLMPAFRELKRLFDPEGLLNPGKILSLGGIGLTENLRQVRYPLMENLTSANLGEENGQAKPAVIELQLSWQPEEMAQAARACNGCGVCRVHELETRMCPIFRVLPAEEASPRAKANLTRGVLTGMLPQESIFDDRAKEIADLCVHCHMCRIECPANVDVPKLMVEAKASYLSTNGESLYGWCMSNIDWLCDLGGRHWRLSNWVVGNRGARWLLEKTTGIARGRKLPRFRKEAFLDRDRPAVSTVSKPDEKVLYFVDTFANHCDGTLAEAFLEVLEHNGIVCDVPTRQLPSGMPLIARGRVADARSVAERNVALLAEAVRQGYKIVATEPSAALALTHEYPMLMMGDEDARMVAENSYEACHYLWLLHQRGKLRLNFRKLEHAVAYHVPCHSKALQIGTPAVHLLRLIPGLRVEHLEKGCSGIAGMYGFQRKNFRNSLRAGLPLITAVRQGDFDAGVTECSTCKIQMEQSTTRPTIHPVKVLALAYGLMPELESLFSTQSGELVVT